MFKYVVFQIEHCFFSTTHDRNMLGLILTTT